jgi:hypothetical protein
VNDLLVWQQRIALDPAVSKEAHELHAEIARLNIEVARLRADLADYEHSFPIFERASRALMDAYKAAHPDVSLDTWPDMTTVNEWAAAEIERLRVLHQDAAAVQPFDHNVECTYCDEQAGHRADCPWLLALLQQKGR